MFNVSILNPRKILFEGEAWSVFLPGSTGEFEVLELHKSIISVLKKGEIVIDWDKSIYINKGIVKVKDDKLVALVE